MKSPSEDILDMLVADSSLGIVKGTNGFIGREPNRPDQCVTIYDTPGRGPQLTFDKTERYEYPSVQVRVRDNDYLTGWALITDITTSLHGRAQETWNDALYTVIYCTSGPAMLSWDEKGRVSFIVNFNLQRR